VCFSVVVVCIPLKVSHVLTGVGMVVLGQSHSSSARCSGQIAKHISAAGDAVEIVPTLDTLFCFVIRKDLGLKR
jgi:hypothetical protein